MPVAAIAEPLIVFVDAVEGRTSEDSHAGIVDEVECEQVSEELSAVVDSHSIGRRGVMGVLLGQQPALGINQTRVAEGNGSIGVELQLSDQSAQKVRLGHVVALGNPYVFALGEAETAVPLQESAARVLLVAHHAAHSAVALIARYHLKTVVRRAVVEDDNLYRLVGLREYAFDALRQESSVVVVRNDD